MGSGPQEAKHWHFVSGLVCAWPSGTEQLCICIKFRILQWRSEPVPQHSVQTSHLMPWEACPRCIYPILEHHTHTEQIQKWNYVLIQSRTEQNPFKKKSSCLSGVYWKKSLSSAIQDWKLASPLPFSVCFLMLYKRVPNLLYNTIWLDLWWCMPEHVKIIVWWLFWVKKNHI